MAPTSVTFPPRQPQPPVPAASNDKEETLKVLDQLVEQNHKLEQQNRELMEQVNILRQKLAAQPATRQPAASQPTAAATANGPVPAVTPQQPAKQAQDKNAAPKDDTTLLPQASDGEPGVFGEFNP